MWASLLVTRRLLAPYRCSLSVLVGGCVSVLWYFNALSRIKFELHWSHVKTPVWAEIKFSLIRVARASLIKGTILFFESFSAPYPGSTASSQGASTVGSLWGCVTLTLCNRSLPAGGGGLVWASLLVTRRFLAPYRCSLSVLVGECVSVLWLFNAISHIKFELHWSRVKTPVWAEVKFS